MSWEIRSKDGVVKAIAEKVEYNDEWMQECYVSATIESPAPIDFQIGDYLIYRDERFEINYAPGKIKSAPQYEKGDAFKYENVKFNSLADELTQCDFLDVVLNDNQLHFTGLPKFSFYGGVKQLAARIQANLDRAYGKNTWQVKIAEEFSGTEERNVSVDNIKVQGALSILVNDFKTYYAIKGRTLTIGAAGIPADHLFKYGKGQGLYEIEENAEADQQIVTRLRAYGSTRNIPHRYYNDLSGADGKKLIPDNMAVQYLMLPEFPYTTQDPYIDSKNIDALGVREGTLFFDGSNPDLPETYPSIEGMTAEQLKAAGVPCNATGELDVLVSAEQMTDNGVGKIEGDAFEGNATTTAEPATFKVTIKDVGFDINDHLTTQAATISFKSGMLGGREFEIVDCKKDGNNYVLELNRVFDEDIKLWFPYKDYNAKQDDKFVLLNIKMPEVYIKAASQLLKERAQAWLDKNDYSRSVYAPKIDEIFMARQHDTAMASGGTIKSLHDTLRAGVQLLFEDEDLHIDAAIFIDRLTIVEGEGPIPTYEVVLKEEKTVGRLDKMQNQIDSLAAGQGQGGGGYTASQIRSLINAYGGQLFLSKLKDDRSAGLIASDKGFDVGDFLAGASGARLGKDAETGKTHLEVDYIYARVKAYFESLTIMEANTLAGKQYITPGGSIKCAKVEETETAYRCYFLSEQDGEKTETKIIVGDQAISEMFNAATGTANKVSNHRYWRLVTAVNNDAYADETGNRYGYIDLSKSDCENNSDEPKEGDIIDQFGNRNDSTRQAAMVFDTVSPADAPSIKLFVRIGSGDTNAEHYSLDKRDIISYGYDSVKGNAYFRCYGDTYFGARDAGSFIEFNEQEKSVHLNNVVVSLGSKIGDRTFEQLLEGVDAGKYLREALRESTVVDNGLVLTSAVLLGYTNSAGERVTMAGHNGLVPSSITDAVKRGRVIASFWGGGMTDRYYDAAGALRETALTSGYAASLVRMDGTGYFCGGNIRFEKDYALFGSEEKGVRIGVDGSFMVGSGVTFNVGNVSGLENTLSELANFNIGLNNLLVPIGKDGKPKSWTYAATNPDDIESVMVTKGLWSTKYVSTKGVSEDSGTGTGTVVNLLRAWEDYNPNLADSYALSAGLGYSLYNEQLSLAGRVSLLEDGAAVSLENYYTKSQSDGRYYTKTESDSRFQPAGDYALASALAGYLPLTGGTLTGKLTAEAGVLAESPDYGEGLEVRRSGIRNAAIKFSNTAGLLGYIGIGSAAGAEKFRYQPCFKSPSSAADLLIWTEGNDGAGSGLDADLLDGYHESSFLRYRGGLSDATNAVAGVGTYGWNASATGFGSPYGDSLVIQGQSTWYNRLDFRTDGRIDFWQAINPSSLAGCMARKGTIAYLTDNVRSASQLATARKIFGNDFDGTADISVMALGQMRHLNFTGTDGSTVVGWVGRSSASNDNIALISYTSEVRIGANSSATDIVVTTGHKVGVGTASPAYKLDVAGAIRASEVVIGGATLSWDGKALKVNTGFYSTEFVSTKGVSNDSGAPGSGIDVTFLAGYLAEHGYVTASSLGNYVDKTSAQEIGGQKTFTSNVTSFTRRVEIKGATTEYAAFPELLLHIPNVNYSKLKMDNGGTVHLLAGSDTDWTSYKSIKAASFVRKGGTSAQFLKADGSVDGNSYARSVVAAGVNMQNVAGYGNAMGMIMLNGSNSNDNPNGQTGWHHYVNMSYNVEANNMWQTQIAVKAGTTDLWVRSRSGGSVASGLAWVAPWTRILTGSNYSSVLDSSYVKKSGDGMTGALRFAKTDTTMILAPDNIANNSLVEWRQDDKVKGRVYWSPDWGMLIQGSKSDGTPFACVGSDSLYWYGSNKFWHSGNMGAGSGLNADMLDGVHLSAIPHYGGWVSNPGYDAKTRGNFIRFTYGNNAPGEGPILSISANGYGFQLWTNHYTDQPLWYRRYGAEGDGDWGAWHQLARITDNVASASKLQTAHYIWGQSFDGTGGIDGLLTLNYSSGNCGIELTRTGGGECSMAYNTDGKRFVTGVWGSPAAFHVWSPQAAFPHILNISADGKVAIGKMSGDHMLDVAGAVCSGDWFYTSGNHGWYNTTYGGGWTMTDSTWIRIYGGKSLYVGSGVIRTDGQLQVGGNGSKFLVDATGAASCAGRMTATGGFTSPDTAENYFGRLAIATWDGEIWLLDRTDYDYSSMKLRVDGSLLPGSASCNLGGTEEDEWLNGYIYHLYSTNIDTGTILATTRLSVGKSGIGNYGSLKWDNTAKAIYTDEGFYSTKFVSTKGAAETSDMRLKRVVGSVDLTVAEIAAAPLFLHEWRDGSMPGTFVGSSAQYWEKVLPQIVICRDGKREMFYSHLALAAGIVNSRAIERMTARYDRWLGKHETRVQRLERRIKELENELEILKKSA